MPYTPQQLSDHHDITDVIHAYCRAIDDNRPDDVVKLFVDECDYDYGGELGSFSTKAYAYKFFRAGTDLDLARISANDHTWPDTGSRPYFNVANEIGRFRNECGWIDFW